jgi:hypothetical protein
MAVEPKSARSRRRDNAAGSLVGPQGRPLREYRGWDAAREVFVMDGPDAEVLFSEPASPHGPSDGVVTNGATNSRGDSSRTYAEPASTDSDSVSDAVH